MRKNARLKNSIAALVIAAGLTVSLTACDTSFTEIGKSTIQDISKDTSEQETNVTSEEFGTTVIRVIDGDTITVEVTDDLPANTDSGSEHVVRLLGIDAPEIEKRGGTPAECGGDLAKEALAGALSKGTPVTLTFDTNSDHTDKYDRSLAYVELNGADINGGMVAGGYVAAWHPSGTVEPERFANYSAFQEEAAANKAGAWADCDTLGR